jgi:CDP-paratose 2-epimerase
MMFRAASFGLRIFHNILLPITVGLPKLWLMGRRKVLITGGAGFIGVNAAHRFLKEGWEVSVWDNLSRYGAERNLRWLLSFGPAQFTKIDLREEKAVNDAFQQKPFDLVLHCAGQVAVTSSLGNPRHDLENNVLTTFNLLEAVRLFRPETLLIFASSNKVYGNMTDTPVVERNGRYELATLPHGASEQQPLDFHSPYGCSKGAADQYVRDYARIYGLATTCFRQSCVYGCRQFGVEDQGWVAWFLIAHALGRPITIFGDGKQTRDLLFIDDLIEAYCLAWEKREKVVGNVYNIGGGPENQFSVREIIQLLEQEGSAPVQLSFHAPRPGDQKVFVADIRKAFADFGWRPVCSVENGIRKLRQWVKDNLELFREMDGERTPWKYANPLVSESGALQRPAAGSPPLATGERTTP